MAILKLYHGSKFVVQKPTFGIGKTNNDYGQGFYCTEHIDLAKEWACTEDSNGYANCYELDTKGLFVLNLSDDQYSFLNWLAVLLQNRAVKLSNAMEISGQDYILHHFLPDYQSADIIIGYRADDSYFSFVRSFVSNQISLEQLGHVMKFGKLGEQVVLKSEKSFSKIHFCGFEVAEKHIYYAHRKARNDKAKSDFSKLEIDYHGIFIRDILREEMMPDDPRLQ